MALFIVLSIIAVFACINQHRGIMALAAMGTALMFLVMHCQLLTSIIVRRWWNLVGAIIAIIISLLVWICTIVALAAGQYRPPIRTEQHDISDIMLIIAHQEDPGELLSNIRTAWEQYAQPWPTGTTPTAKQPQASTVV